MKIFGRISFLMRPDPKCKDFDNQKHCHLFKMISRLKLNRENHF